MSLKFGDVIVHDAYMDVFYVLNWDKNERRTFRIGMRQSHKPYFIETAKVVYRLLNMVDEKDLTKKEIKLSSKLKRKMFKAAFEEII